MEYTKRLRQHVLGGFSLALVAALLFSCKAILGKLIYQVKPIPVSQLLVLRMLFSLPLYSGIYLFNRYSAGKKYIVLGPEMLWRIAAVGLLGYYLSSYFDFLGLKFISAGLERVILFTYPTMVVLFGAWFFKQRIRQYQWLALALCYAGVVLSFWSDLDNGDQQNVLLGSASVGVCAVLYALYVLFSSDLIKAAGVYRFTSLAMMVATAGVTAHYFVGGNTAIELLQLPPRIYLYLALMAVFTTVIPSILISAGIKMIGSQNLAITSSVGPVFTIIIAYYVLGETVTWFTAIGSVLVVAGVYLVGKKAKKQ